MQFSEAVVTSLKVMAGAVSQLSVAVAFPVMAGNVLAVHSIVEFPGQLNTGEILSVMTIVWVHVLKLPHASVADHVLAIVYA